MLYRVVIGDAAQVRGIVELEIDAYKIEDGALAIFVRAGEDVSLEVGRWATGHWRSIVNVELWNKARKAGVGDENSRGRIAPRQAQAI